MIGYGHQPGYSVRKFADFAEAPQTAARQLNAATGSQTTIRGRNSFLTHVPTSCHSASISETSHA